MGLDDDEESRRSRRKSPHKIGDLHVTRRPDGNLISRTIKLLAKGGILMSVTT
jgi:hypothetical protein